METKNDVWTEKQVEMFSAYSTDNQTLVAEMILQDPNLALALIQNFMKDKLSNSLMRERVVARNEGVIHSFAMHDYDGRKNNRPVEIKNEQHNSGGRRDQIVGGAAFSGIEDYHQIQRLVDDNPIMLLSGWVDGKLAYTVEFDFNDSTIADRLTRAVKSRKEEENTTAPKFLWSDWRDAESLKVTYLDMNIFVSLEDVISGPLWNMILLTYLQSDVTDSVEYFLTRLMFASLPQKSSHEVKYQPL